MTELKTVCFRMEREEIEEFEESIEKDEGFSDKSEAFRYLVRKWNEGRIW